MSKSNNHSNNTSSSNLRRYGDDELESSIGAIFDNIDFSSMEKPEVNDEGASLESNNRRLSENRSQYSTNDNDDGMKDAINNALNDVFDFRDKHNEEEGKNNLQGFKDVDESKHPTHGYTEGDTLPKSTELNSAPSVPENQELDDAIDSAFDNLLQDQVPSQGEKSPKEDSHKVRHQEDLALVSEINSLMQTGAQEEVQNNSVKALSTRRDKPSETEIPSSLVKGELDQERKEADNYFASKSVEVDNEDDDLDLAIRSALGNIFEKESAEATAENKDQVVEEQVKIAQREEVPLRNVDLTPLEVKQDEPVLNISKQVLNIQSNNEKSSLASTAVPFEGKDKTLDRLVSQNQGKTTTSQNEDLDENLRGIIGQAFDEIFGKDMPGATNTYQYPQREAPNKSQSKSQSNQAKSRKRHVLESTLNPAVQKNIVPDQAILQPSGHLSPHISSSDTSKNEQDEDQYLLDAIGAAFRSIEEASSIKQPSDSSSDFGYPVSVDKLITDDTNKDENYKTKPYEKVGDSTAASDQDIEDAIADAFKSAMSAEAVISDKTTGKSKKNDAKQITARKKSIKTLANEITQQVQDHFKGERRVRERLSSVTGLPYGQTISASHLQKDTESQNIQKGKSDKKLHTVITSAVKNAVGTEKDDEIVDIEQLQMNEILQNAIKMASENPQELISDLEIDQIIDLREQGKTNVAQTSNASLVIQGAKHKPLKVSKPTKDQLRVPPSLDDKYKTSLSSEAPRSQGDKFSIASGPISKEEYAKNSFLANPDVKSQISSVMSSLTSRINSGELADTNILFTIRQITEELASGGSLTKFLSKDGSLGENVFNKEDRDVKMLANGLGMARKFLLGFPSESSAEGKAVDEINTMISNLNEDFSENLLLTNEKAEFISTIANSTLTALVDDTIDIKYSFETFDEVELFKNTSPEIRRRTRIGNRERKKKWREENAERNRDMELKTRVIKKAYVKFGEGDTPSKLSWIESEFEKRKARRQPRSHTDDERNEDVTVKTEDTPSQNSSEKVEQVTQDKRLINNVKDVLKIFYERPDHLKTASHVIKVASIIGALSLLHSESFQLNEAIMLAGMKSILKSITDRLHSLDGHRTMLSSAQLRTESSKRRLSEILNNAKRSKVDMSAFPAFDDTASHSFHVKDGTVSKPSLQLPRTSPFISHKIGSSANATTTGLRKPSSFQKPKAFERPGRDKSRGGSLGSPKLYSASS